MRPRFCRSVFIQPEIFRGEYPRHILTMGSMPEQTSDYPPLKLLVQAMEEKAKWTPYNTIFRYAPMNWEDVGYKTITWRQFINAVDKVAYWLDEQLGKATDEIETVAYFGPNDARYAIMVPVCIKTGRRVSFVI